MSTQTKPVYIAAAEPQAGKSAVGLGVIDALQARGRSVGVFRPIVTTRDDDEAARHLIDVAGLDQSLADALGSTYAEVADNTEGAIASIVSKMGALRHRYDTVVVIGSDYSDVSDAIEVSLNARIAANLDAVVLGLVNGEGMDVAQIRRSTQYLVGELHHQHLDVLALIINRVEPDLADAARDALVERRDPLFGDAPVFVLPRHPVLRAPTVREEFEQIGATLCHGSEAALDGESLATLASGMTLPNLLAHLVPGATLVMASDRCDLLPGILLSQTSEMYPRLSALVLVGGYPISDFMMHAIDELNSDLPIALVDTDTFTTVSRLHGLLGSSLASPHKVVELRRLLADHVDWDAILTRLEAPRRSLRTQHRFEYDIVEQAKADLRSIVLPESEDPRVLTAAAIALERGMANIILLGEADQVRADAARLGLDIAGATIASMHDAAALERYAAAYAELRRDKGITLEQARAKLADPSYWGTMMVKLGEADAMVSGATHTTANTIRPAFEVIKTKPGIEVVSGAFFMCMSDQVWLFADCAVNPNPTASQLASIAISSAESAAAFGIDPRVAMLSYSTGTSGTGPDVELVAEATALVRQRRPDLLVEGPLQFDAAVDFDVAKLKLPGSPVAGQATVFIFPDLDAGNIAYKAVQRTSGATAVGPILQGLNKTVTDLSRGARVDDIVSTIALTAVQAQAGSAR